MVHSSCSHACFFLSRRDLSKQSNEYEIVDFIVDRFKRVTGLGDRKRKQAPVAKSSVDHTDYVEGTVCPTVGAVHIMIVQDCCRASSLIGLNVIDKGIGHFQIFLFAFSHHELALPRQPIQRLQWWHQSLIVAELDGFGAAAQRAEERLDMFIRRVLAVAQFKSNDKQVWREIRGMQKRRRIVVSA